MGNKVLQQFEDSSSMSTQAVAADLGISQKECAILCILNKKIYPFHIQNVQPLPMINNVLVVEFVS